MFKPSEELEIAIADHNYEEIHSIIKLLAKYDHEFKEGDVRAAVKYVSSKIGLDFIQPFDGRELRENPDEWNDDYRKEVVRSLTNNFSMERIEHIEAICRHLYADKAPIEAPASEKTPPKAAQRTAQKTAPERKSQAPTGASERKTSGSHAGKSGMKDSGESAGMSEGKKFLVAVGAAVVLLVTFVQILFKSGK